MYGNQRTRKKIQLNKLQYGLLHITNFQIKNVVSLWTKTPNGRFGLMSQCLTWVLFPETLSGSVITQQGSDVKHTL